MMADHPAHQQERAEGYGIGVQDGQSGGDRVEKQRIRGLRLQDVRSYPQQAR